jgi:hypothetical protein
MGSGKSTCNMVSHRGVTNTRFTSGVNMISKPKHRMAGLLYPKVISHISANIREQFCRNGISYALVGTCLDRDIPPEMKYHGMPRVSVNVVIQGPTLDSGKDTTIESQT